MTSDSRTGEAPSLRARAEAAAWLALLRGPNRSGEAERGFQRWRQANASHERAFELLSERLEAAEALRGRRLPPRWRPAKLRESNWRVSLRAVAACALAIGTVVFYFHDRGVSTAVGEQRTLTLRDGSHIYLNTDTRVFVRYDDEIRGVEIEHGEALFEVAPQPDRPFVVTAGDRRITALGTAFIVRRLSGQVAVTLVEGKVAVSDPGGESARQRQSAERPIEPHAYTLTSGQRLTFTSAERARFDEPSIEKATAWRRGQVALDDVPLSLAAAEMNRYSDVKLVIESPQAADLRVGGFFRMGDSMSFARAVADAYCLELIEHPGKIVLSDPQRANDSDGGVGSTGRCV